MTAELKDGILYVDGQAVPPIEEVVLDIALRQAILAINQALGDKKEKEN